MKKMTHYESIALILSGLFLWIWMRQASLSVYNESGVFHGRNFNLAAYLGGAFCTFLLYLLLTQIPALIVKRTAVSVDNSLFVWAMRLIYGTVTTVMLYAIYRVYRDETIIYPGDVVASYFRHTVPHKPYYLAILLLAMMTLWCLRRRYPAGRRVRVVLITVFSGINALLLFAPNLLEDRGGGIQHIDAYVTSITNVMHFVPFGKTSMSIYGHYALLYLPFVKLFGNSYLAIALTIALFAALTYFAVCFAASIVIKSDWVLFCTMAAVTGTTTILSRRGQYYQINPHRILFPALVILLIVLEEYRFTKAWLRRELILELIVGILAITWNLETGLFSVIILSAHHVFRRLGIYRLFSHVVWMEIGTRMLYCIVSFFGAWSLTGVYNLLTGGSFGSVKTYIYPLLSGTYNVNNLRLPLPGATALYVFQILLFVLTAISVLRSQILTLTDDPRRAAVLFSVSLSGCSSIVYFLNRTAFGNTSIQHMQTALLLGLLIDSFVSLDEEDRLHAMIDPHTMLPALTSFVLYFGLIWLAVEALITMPIAASNRAQATWSMGSMNALIKDISETVPKDTLATGIGLPALYQQMGWDTRCHTIDTLDMNEVNRELRDRLIAQEPAILTTDAPDETIWEIKAQWPLANGDLITYAIRR